MAEAAAQGLTLLPNSSFLTGEGEGGVGHGTYSLSGDLLVLTYHTEGVEDTILYHRVVIQGRMMLLFQTEQRYGNQGVEIRQRSYQPKHQASENCCDRSGRSQTDLSMVDRQCIYARSLLQSYRSY